MANGPDHDTSGDARTLAAPLDPVPALSAAQAPPLVAGRYEILGMLGAGGMGTVYRARDRELDETVALKLLRRELASSATMLERFRREVKLARRVTHRNVARTFDIGDNDGERFLTMELVEGEMLGARLARRGRLSLREVVAIGVDVSAGLAAAHAAGVLHRDLKPENVILAKDGRAVITDFGIARVVAGDGAGHTVGGIIGTPAYMAPEQVEGAEDIDARADLYALGAMLFELLSGHAAWSGSSAISVAAARLLKPPPDVRLLVPDLPEAPALLLLRLMARARDERPATAEEAGRLIAELEQDLPSRTPTPSLTGITAPLAALPTRAQRTIVAVLPLLNLGPDDDDYLAQTLTEDLVDLLSVVPTLRVRPRGDTRRYTDPSRDLREAGRALAVDVVVDGSLRRIDGVVRFSVRLATVEDGFQLWAKRFDGPPAFVLEVADKAASAIAEALTAVRAPSPRVPVSDPEAQDLYLRGRFLLHRAWFEVSKQGVDLLREAHRRAPDDTRIAGTYALGVARILASESSPAVSEARELAEKTLTTDPSQPEARVALGFLHVNSGEYAAAAAELVRAVAVAPNSVEALDVIGRLLVEVGRAPLGVKTLRRALAIDPQLAHGKHSIARVHALSGDYMAALQELGPVPSSAGDFVPYIILRGRFALWHDDRAAGDVLLEAVARADAAGLLSPFSRLSLTNLGRVTKMRAPDPDLLDAIDKTLPLGGAFSPRRTAYHAQLRTEMKLAIGLDAEALADLRVAESNGLVDISWVDECRVFDRVRHTTELKLIREATALRAARVAQILDPAR